MSLKLDLKRRLTARSDRVKCVDQHPTDPWILCALYNGQVHVWNYESESQVKSFEVCDLPVRAAKFVARKNWVVTGSDDMLIRVFNYNTLELVHSFEAHCDYIRCIIIHPTQPYIMSSSDDLLIKLWTWDKKWFCQKVFEGHSHYVMQIVINPKDSNTFASASLDRTIKVWQLGASNANFTLEGHEKGVNCVDYYHGGDRPYLVSGADDRLVKIWDYQTKTCVRTLENHAQNVTSVCFHPDFPILFTGSEDGTVRVWHAPSYSLQCSLNYGLERVWNISAARSSNNIAIGYDEGTVLIQVGRDEPPISMDVNGGKIVWARNFEVQQVNLKALSEGESEIKEGKRLQLSVRELGNCDIYPRSLSHNANGRFVAACGAGEYAVYTAVAFRSKAYGLGQLVWAPDSAQFGVLHNSTVRMFKNYKEINSVLQPEYGAEEIFGGQLLGVKSGASFAFYDWETLELVRRLEVRPLKVYWSDGGAVSVATESEAFVLSYKPPPYASEPNEDGYEDAFEVVAEMKETVTSGLWIGDCFVYTNGQKQLNYYVGGEIVTVAHLDCPHYVLGYVAKENRLYLNDKDLNISSYSLVQAVLEYQTAVMRGDFESADGVLPRIALQHRTRVAQFLEKQVILTS